MIDNGFPALVLVVLLHVVLIAVVAWDLWAISQGRPKDTVSNILHGWSMRWPELLIVLGMLLHHVVGTR